jgi:hypothetical protein
MPGLATNRQLTMTTWPYCLLQAMATATRRRLSHGHSPRRVCSMKRIPISMLVGTIQLLSQANERPSEMLRVRWNNPHAALVKGPFRLSWAMP